MKKIALGLLAFLVMTTPAFGRRLHLFKKNKNFFHSSLSSKRYTIPASIDDCFARACTTEYTSDEGKDYWQKPLETIERKKGDCEDMAFHLYWLLKREGYSARVVIGYMDGDKKKAHAWVECEEDNETIILEATTHKKIKKSLLLQQQPQLDYIEYEGEACFQNEIKDFITSFSEQKELTHSFRK